MVNREISQIKCEKSNEDNALIIGAKSGHNNEFIEAIWKIIEPFDHLAFVKGNLRRQQGS